MARTSKLTEEQKIEIANLYKESKEKKIKVSYNSLAARYEVSPATIMRIVQPEIYERQLAANREYQTNNLPQILARKKGQYRHFKVSYNVETDREIIDFLERQENITEYIRTKVNEDIEKSKGPEK